ncbi:MAG: hypothetical protein ACRDCN_02560 [Tannerellaceae bacterium]
MKQISILSALCLCMVALTFTSCSNENEPEIVICPVDKALAFESTGGRKELPIAFENWEVAVVLSNSASSVFGDIYDENNNLIQENSPMKLAGPGRMTSNWDYKGFSVTHTSDNKLIIDIHENFYDESFTYDLLLTSGEYTQRIPFEQKKSAGYSLEKITYSLSPGDGDSIYTEQSRALIDKIIVHSNKPVEMTVLPFYNIFDTHIFTSDDKRKEILLGKDSVEVDIPNNVYDDKIYFDTKPSIYNYAFKQRDCSYKGVEVTRLFEPGTTKQILFAEFKQTKVSYTATYINKETQTTYEVKGKFIRVVPTGKYELTFEHSPTID